MDFDQTEQLLYILNSHGVKYILIGGLAAALHGAPCPVEDVDITPEASQKNLACLSEALKDLEAVDPTLDELYSTPLVKLTTRLGTLGISLNPSGTRGYADLMRTKIRMDIGQQDPLIVDICSLENIIRSKEAAGRDKDLHIVPILKELAMLNAQI